MTLPPSQRGRASDGTAPGIASQGAACAGPMWYEAGEAVWLAVQRERLILDARAVRAVPEDSGTADAAAPDPEDRPGAADRDCDRGSEPVPRAGDTGSANSDGSASGAGEATQHEATQHEATTPVSGHLGTVGSAGADGAPGSWPARTGPRGRARVSSLRAEPAPERSRAMEKALRPLRRWLDAGNRWSLDEEATAETTASHGGWLPCFRPERERWLTVSLVVEFGDSWELWRGTAGRFAATLECSGAFRDVRVCPWRSQPGRAPVEGAPALPAAPPGRHLVLLLTDMLSGRWSDGSALRQLARWAAVAPVAVVQVLPEHLWSRTSVVPYPARLRCPAPAAANALWSWRPDDSALLWEAGLEGEDGDGDGDGDQDGDRNGDRDRDRDRDRDGDGYAGRSREGGGSAAGGVRLPVPVVGLTPTALVGWARFVRGNDRSEFAARVLEVPSGPAAPVPHPPPGSTWPGRLPAGDQVRSLRARLSPTAYHLAQLGASIPLNLGVLQLVRRELLPEARTWHLVELLLSGVLQPAEPETSDVPESVRVEFDFVEGVRQELLAEGTRRETALAMKVAFDHLSRNVAESLGAVLREVRDMVADPGRAARLPLERVRPWLTPVLPALTALDGQYTVAAADLSRRLAAEQGPPSAAADGLVGSFENVFGEEEFDAPELVSSGTASDIPVNGASGFSPESEEIGDSCEDVGGDVSVRGASSAPGKARAEGMQKPPPVWGNVPPRNRAFTGRVQLMEDLHRRLQEGTTAVLPEALQGLGGVGKSQLAVEYVYRHQNQYQVIWWIPSEQSQQIRQLLVELARRLGLDVGSGEANTAVPAVIEALRIGEPYKNWLLVFDNAEDPEAVREFFPTNGPGRILVTSRNAQWAAAARPLEVDVFERHESRQLLQLRAPTLDDDTADRLAETLGDLPLGIEQAAVWLAETGMPADEYLRLFDQQAAELMMSDPPPDYPLSVAAAWNVSLERLKKNHPASLQLLQVCAFFAPEPISRRLLTNVRDAPVPPELAAALSDPIRLGRAIRQINRYALARINHSTDTIQLHRLVQLVLINQMPDALKEQMRNGAHRLLSKGDPGEPTNSRHWQQYGDLLPHVFSSRAVQSSDPWVRQLVLNEAQYMYSWGDHEGARQLAEEAYQTWKRADGEDSEHVLMAAKLYSDALRILGHYREAHEQDQRTHAAMEEMLGPEHEMTLEITSMLAWDLRMRGNFVRAAELDRQVFETSRRLFGPNDPSTLLVAHRVALNLRLTGDFREALELDQDTYRRKLEELGENAMSTLHTLAGVAVDRQEAGDYLGARDQQQEVSNRYEFNFGRTNPSTISSVRGLAVAERRAGRHPEALELSTQALELYRNRYGENFPETLATLLAYAVDIRHGGDLRQALDLSEQGCKGYEHLFGADHPHTLAAQVNHAVCLRLLGRADDARSLNERIRDALSERLGPDHPNVLACAVNLTADLYELGEIQACVELGTRNLHLGRQRLGEDHPTTLAAAVNLTLGLRLLDRGDEADELMADTLERYGRVLGLEHPATVAVNQGKLANCDLDPMPL